MIADFYAEDGAMYADALLAKTALESFKVQQKRASLFMCSRVLREGWLEAKCFVSH